MTQQATKEVRPDGKLRLPPGQHLTTGWPVLHYGSIPRIDLESWRFHVWGLVDEEKTFTWEQFNALGSTTEVNDIHCVTSWSRYDNRWDGVSTHDLMGAVQPAPEVTHVLLTSNDGYTTNLALEDFSSPEAILAHSWEGQPLPLDHGGPVRLVVPHLSFWKSAKWIRKIEFATADHPGFWEVRGYHNRGDPWREERYS